MSVKPRAGGRLPGEAAKCAPRTPVSCEWCDAISTVHIERRGGRKWLPLGQFVHACSQHAALARTITAKPERKSAE